MEEPSRKMDPTKSDTKLTSPQNVMMSSDKEFLPSNQDLSSSAKPRTYSHKRTPKPFFCECCCYVAKRYVIVAMLSLGMLIVHAMRVNVAVTVVTILDKEPHTIVGTPQAITNLPDVEWDARMVGLLHSVFYMGYIITQIPGGYLATLLPAHRMFGAVIVCSGALNLLLPVGIAKGGYGITLTIRIFQGLFEGMVYPTCYAVMRHWTTPEERSRTGAVVLTGTYLGPVVGYAVSGAITHYVGWQYVYYLHGLGAITWFLLWLILSYETPADHPFISDDELAKIEKAQGDTALIYKEERIPWKSIFTSMPVHALNVCNFARNWVFYLMLTNEPLYLNMFHYSLATNGVFSALPHLVMAIVALISGPFADFLSKDSLLSRTGVRKMFTGIGFGMEAACMLMLGFVVAGLPAIAYLTIGIGVSGLTVSGWQINHLDLAPRYAGVLVALSTTVGTVAGISIPLITGWLTQNQEIEEWHTVFYLTTGILLFSVIFYSIFGSGDLQSWAEPRSLIRIVPGAGPLDSGKKPYGTFPAQIDYDSAQPVKETPLDYEASSNQSDSTLLKRHKSPVTMEKDKEIANDSLSTDS